MENDPSLSQPTPANWFPHTKFQPPQAGATLTPRSRPQTILATAVSRHKVTLVAAPAGSGKTSLVAALAHGVSPGDAPDAPIAWAALDAADDDLAVFTAVLVAALKNHLQNEGTAVLNFLQSVPNSHNKTARLAALFINQLNAQAAARLILDDYQAIADPAIQEFLTYFVDYLPPAFRLIIVTRHDPPLPLPRWRSRGELAEIRLPQLRFDEGETAAFLTQRHQLHLSDQEIAALQQYTEGWAAGLQLLAAVLAAIPEGEERVAYIQRLGAANRSIFDLLAAEVLALQPAEVQEFLLQTAVLPELTPDNCRAVSENPAAARLLADLYRRNLFLTALAPDAHSGPFRYHDLFRSFLQQRLMEERPEQWPELHRRAARAAVNDEQKLYHLISAELWPEAAQLLEKMGRLDSERRFTRRSVVNGIESLPAAVRLAHPWLLLFMAQFHAIRGRADAAAPWREQAAARFREEGDELGEIELLVIAAILDTADTDETINAFRQKVAASSRLMRPDHWAVYHGNEQWYAFMRYDWPALTDHVQANINRTLQSGDPGALAMTTLTIGPQMLFNDQGMDAIEAFAQHALRTAGRDDWILQICARGLLGAIRFFQGRVDEAERAGREAHRLLVEIGGLAWVDHHICWLVMTLALARRAYHSFDEFLAAQAPRWQTQDTALFYQKGVMYLHGRSLWLRNRVSEAQAVLTKMQAAPISFGYETEDKARQLLLGSLVATSQGNTGAAKRDLQEAITLHETVRHTIMLTHPRLALATLYGRQNRWADALDEFNIVLNEVKARQMPGIILQEGESVAPLLDYAIKQGVEPEMLRPLRQILQPDGAPQAIPLPNSDEYLTPRESEVLRLLATGATNPAIAAELSVTERTVKAHVTRILAKLNAATRTEAVTKASQLGLI